MDIDTLIIDNPHATGSRVRKYEPGLHYRRWSVVTRFTMPPSKRGEFIDVVAPKLKRSINPAEVVLEGSRRRKMAAGAALAWEAEASQKAPTLDEFYVILAQIREYHMARFLVEVGA